MGKLQTFLVTTLLSTAVTTVALERDANAIVFNFSGNGSNGSGAPTLQFEESGLELNVTASTHFVGFDILPAHVTQRNLGLGVNTIGPDSAQINGHGFGFGETLSLAFGTTGEKEVILRSATFANADGNDQFTLFADGNLFIDDQSIPNGGLFSFSSYQRADRTASVFDFQTTDFTDDYFLSAVNVDVVPEPFTVLGTLMAGAWGLQFRRRQRHKLQQQDDI